MARYELFEVYNNKPTQYKAVTLMDAYCIEFESFPIAELSKTGTGV